MPKPQRAPSQSISHLVAEQAANLLRMQFARQVVSGGRHLTLPSFDQDLQDKLSREVNEWWQHLQPDTPPPPPPRLDELVFKASPITFDNGVPVGGSSNLSLFPDGAFNFSGSFRDSGAPSYNDAIVWVIASSAGSSFVFQHSGRLHGTFESGSRDDIWNDSGTNAALADAWNDISAGYNCHWQAGVNMDLGQLVDAAMQAVGAVGKVITVVGAL